MQLARQNSQFLTPKEYAEFHGVHRSTVIRWIKAGKITVVRPGGNRGWFFIPKTEARLPAKAITAGQKA